MNKRKRIYILDPSLRDIRGHHFNLTRLITESAHLFDFSVNWLVHRDFQLDIDINGVEIFNVFSVSMYEENLKWFDRFLKYVLTFPLRAARILLKKLIIFLLPEHFVLFLIRLTEKILYPQKPSAVNELLSVVQSENIGGNDVILVHTSVGEIYRLVLDLVLHPQFMFGSVPTIHLITPYDDSVMPRYQQGLKVPRVINYLRLLGYLNKIVFLYAENELLADYLQKLWNTRIDPICIPVRDFPKIDSIIDPDSINIAYLGAARAEKGFLLMPEIVERIWNSNISKQITFTIQCSEQIVGYTLDIKRAIQKLRKYPANFVRLIDYSVDESQYRSLLDKSDIILLCYNRDRYKVRGSGIAVEAVSAGKIIIATSDTYPCYIANQGGFAIDTVDDIVNAIHSVFQDYSFYHGIAVKNAQMYRRSHSLETYFEPIINNIKASLENNFEANKDRSHAWDNSKDNFAINREIQSMVKMVD